MANSVLLRAKGLYTFQNQLGEIPQGALSEANNVVIDRDGIIGPRRGYDFYGEELSGSPANRAKALLRYKTRVLRHYSTVLDYDDGAGDFTAFNGSYSEVDTGLRIKGVEANGNFYFTTNDGIKKISAASAADLSSSSDFITDAGIIKATDISGRINYTNPGFFIEESKVAYRMVWGRRDANNNVNLGTPSGRLVLTNPSITLTGTTNITVNIPVSGITTSHFFQLYRSAVKEKGSLSLDEIEPEDELNLVYEALITADDIANSSVTVNDIFPEDFRASGTPLYTNPISGDGLTQTNDQPPVAKDITLFKNSTYYANTRTKHNLFLTLLSVENLSSISRLIISDGDVTTNHPFAGVIEADTTTFDTAANTAQSSYYIAYSALNERKYVIWFNKDAGGTEPVAADTDEAIFIEVAIVTGDTAAQVRAKVKTALNAGDNGDFTFVEAGDTLKLTRIKNGETSDTVAGLTAPGGAFAIAVDTQGEGGTSDTILISNNASTAQAIEETAKSIVNVLNFQDPLVNAYYLSGEDDLPGKIFLEKRTRADEHFYLAVSSSTISGNFNPSLPYRQASAITSASNPAIFTTSNHGLLTNDNIIVDNADLPNVLGFWSVTVTNSNVFTIPVAFPAFPGAMASWFKASVVSDNEVNANRLYRSKTQQPEAVPILNYIDVGPRDSAILRILALRDALIILKEDGIYRATGEEGTVPNITLIDSSAFLLAPDSAAILNNQIYAYTTQGIVFITDTGVNVISRPIENSIQPLVRNSNYNTASWGIGYESDRAYLFFTIETEDDVQATQCFRYNTFTTTWTRLILNKTCGVIGSDDKLYLGAGDDNVIEKERKTFDRTDYADRTLDAEISIDTFSSDGLSTKITPISDVDIGDAIVQTQYVTISQFNRLLQKLDIDVQLDDTDYFSTLELEVGNNLRTNMQSLVTKLNSDDATRNTKTFVSGDVNTGTDTITITSHGFEDGDITHLSSSGTLPGGLTAGVVYYIINAAANTFKLSLSEGGTAVNITSGGSGTHTITSNYYFSNTSDFEDTQTEYNIIIDQLNHSEGTFFTNYSQSENTVNYEIIVIDKNNITSTVTGNQTPPWIAGAAFINKGFEKNVIWAPQTMQDPSILKQVREATLMFEERDFYNGFISHRSDLSRNFEEVEFFGTEANLWGESEWGENYWGGGSNSSPLRTLIPQQKQRCRYIETQYRHINAFEAPSLLGVSLTFEQNSSRAYR